MGSCVARQPIFSRGLKVYGYELLYRQDVNSVSYDAFDGDKASSETILNTFHYHDVEQVTGGRRAFINFTEKLLLNDVATILPNRVLVIEILETIKPSPQIISKCQHLRKQGYTLALDDFIIHPEYMPLLAIADIIKIDFLNTDREVIKKFAEKLSGSKILLLAEKIETQEDFEFAKALGFNLFQGYFFSKPVIVKNSEDRLRPIKMHCIELISLAYDENVDFTKISNVIKHDVALTYRLLRLVNSAYFGLRHTVKNVRQALAILGLNEVRKWIILISLSELSEDKPDELVRMSLIRGKFLESLSYKVHMASAHDDLYILGLMSLMDAIMDREMSEVVEIINIAPEIAQPLMEHTGVYGELLDLVIYYERSEWEEVERISAKYGLSEDSLFASYLDAIEWSKFY